MRLLLGIMVVLICTNCVETDEYPNYNQGNAKVFISDGFRSDTLNSCTCWRTKDSLGITIQNLDFGGILVKLSEVSGIVNPNVVYYSDYDEFDGKFELATRTLEKDVTLTIKNSGDTILISGELKLKSEENEYHRLARNITAEGTFECKLKK